MFSFSRIVSLAEQQPYPARIVAIRENDVADARESLEKIRVSNAGVVHNRQTKKGPRRVKGKGLKEDG